MFQMKIEAFDPEERAQHIVLTGLPEECPICHRIGDFRTIRYPAMIHDSETGYTEPEVVFQCPSPHCQRLFIAFYSEGPRDGSYRYQSSIPVTPTPQEFSKSIVDASPSFVKIYNEAILAEAQHLDEICGPGYRKAVEFLIRDWIIHCDPSKKAVVEGQQSLQRCINEHIDSERIKNIATRAWWLGNDFTHYSRRWVTKDIEDLKALIEIVVHFVADELLYTTTLEHMPDQGKPGVSHG